jgi:hypothetical protein
MSSVSLIFTLSVIAVLGVGLALALSLNAIGGNLQYREEWVRAFLQVGLIAVLGVVTSYVLELFKDANQQRRDDSRLRFDVLAELSRAYMDVKLIRRKIQASHSSLTATDADLLNEIQVKFELHKRNSVSLFGKNSELERRLDRMEKYLNRVANKHDSEERRGFSSKEGFEDFADTFEAAAALIRKEIAGR